MSDSIRESGYKIAKQAKIDVTTSEGNYTIDNQTVYLQNAGTALIYIDKQTGVDNTKFELSAGVTSGPWSFTDKIYFVGAATTTLKILVIDM